MSDEPLKLSLFSQSIFPAPISANLLATSPSLDLTATVADANTLAIRRAGGDLVSNTSEKQRLVRALCWKADGTSSRHPPPRLRFAPCYPTVRVQPQTARLKNHPSKQANSSPSPGTTAPWVC